MKALPLGVSMNFTVSPSGRCDVRSLVLLFAMVAAALPDLAQHDAARKLPDHIPPKRTSQIHDGFGINSAGPMQHGRDVACCVSTRMHRQRHAC